MGWTSAPSNTVRTRVLSKNTGTVMSKSAFDIMFNCAGSSGPRYEAARLERCDCPDAGAAVRVAISNLTSRSRSSYANRATIS